MAALLHLDKKGFNALERRFAAEQQHVLLGMMEIERRSCPPLARNLHRAAGSGKNEQPLKDGAVSPDHGFGWRAIALGQLETEDISGEKERRYLPSAILEELVDSHDAAQHLVDVLRRLPLAIDLL